MAKLKFFIHCAANYMSSERNICPNCGGASSTLVDRKYVFATLRRCRTCLMMFRAPIDTQIESNDFYNDSYTQGFTTDMPSAEQLGKLLANNFANTEKDYSRYIALLQSTGVPANATLFDFGCSWGYGSYQLSRAGFEVTSSEVSTPRGRYAKEKLGVNLVDFDAAAAQSVGQYDVFFSSHVLEHVPSPSSVIAKAMPMLKPGGVFIALFPNGSAACRAVLPEWSKLWGEVHPNMIDDVFLNRAFANQSRLFASEAFDQTKTYSRNGMGPFAAFKSVDYPGALYADDLSDYEMYFAARK